MSVQTSPDQAYDACDYFIDDVALPGAIPGVWVQSRGNEENFLFFLFF